MGPFSVASRHAAFVEQVLAGLSPGLPGHAKGPQVAVDPKNVLARIHGMILTALEDASLDVVGWMPSHLTIKDLALQLAMK